jgi:hypothetical protein
LLIHLNVLLVGYLLPQRSPGEGPLAS